jgi:hypothetical protein
MPFENTGDPDHDHATILEAVNRTLSPDRRRRRDHRPGQAATGQAEKPVEAGPRLR